MIFQNQSIGPEVTVDLDTFFYYFIRPETEWPEGEKQGITLHSIRDRIGRMLPRLNHEPVLVHYRRSSNDHVHVRLRFLQDLSVLDGFMIRAWLFDDQTRLSLDLARYFITGSLHEMNRCFDEKATVNGVKTAGPWISIRTNRDDYALEIKEDYKKYLDRFVRQDKQSPLIIGS
jgi:hypothetical protein